MLEHSNDKKIRILSLNVEYRNIPRKVEKRIKNTPLENKHKHNFTIKIFRSIVLPAKPYDMKYDMVNTAKINTISAKKTVFFDK